VYRKEEENRSNIFSIFRKGGRESTSLKRGKKEGVISIPSKVGSPRLLERKKGKKKGKLQEEKRGERKKRKNSARPGKEKVAP